MNPCVVEYAGYAKAAFTPNHLRRLEPKDRVFVTVVRNKGVPSTLNTVTDKVGKGGPILRPYPDWSWTDKDNCKTIINAYRIASDKCNRLWVIDNGHIGNTTICPPKLMVFDLYTDALIGSYEIPENVATNKKGEGFLADLAVQTRGLHCHKTTVYIADVAGSGLVIWNNGRFWRLEGDNFEQGPGACDSTVAGGTVTSSEGVIGIALARRKFGLERLYFRAFSSYDIYSASTLHLIKTYYGLPIIYEKHRNVLTSQPGPIGSSGEVLFFALNEEQAIACHNIRNRLNRENIEIIAQDDETLQFVSGIKVLSTNCNTSPQQLWVVSSRLEKVETDTIEFDEVNFRILVGWVPDLIKGTKCAIP